MSGFLEGVLVGIVVATIYLVWLDPIVERMIHRICEWLDKDNP